MSLFFYFLSLFALFSCSFFEPDQEQFVNEAIVKSRELSSTDHLTHLDIQVDRYLETNVRTKKLSVRTKKFLQSVVDEIRGKNETFFQNANKIEFTCVVDRTPFFLSTPSGMILFSTGLMSKYVKSETFFAAFVAFELIRIEKMIYPKSLAYSRGYLFLPELTKMLQIPVEEKIRIHEWAYYLLSRTRFDETEYLTWLQTLNRNYVDFSTHLVSTSSIFREEREFKSYIAERGSIIGKETPNSRGFYYLRSEVVGM